MQINYPVKYTIMPIKELSSWNYGFDIVANIVSKCYVVGETTKYLGDGSAKKFYEVVFPHEIDDIRYYNNWKRIIPYYNLEEQCLNSVIVKNVFDTFEDALEVSNNKVEELYYKEVENLPFNKNFNIEIKKLKKRHEKTIKKYKKFELQIEENTTDMIVNNGYSRQYNKIYH